MKHNISIQVSKLFITRIKLYFYQNTDNSKLKTIIFLFDSLIPSLITLFLIKNDGS